MVAITKFLFLVAPLVAPLVGAQEPGSRFRIFLDRTGYLATTVAQLDFKTHDASQIFSQMTTIHKAINSSAIAVTKLEEDTFTVSDVSKIKVEVVEVKKSLQYKVKHLEAEAPYLKGRSFSFLGRDFPVMVGQWKELGNAVLALNLEGEQVDLKKELEAVTDLFAKAARIARDAQNQTQQDSSKGSALRESGYERPVLRYLTLLEPRIQALDFTRDASTEVSKRAQGVAGVMNTIYKRIDPPLFTDAEIDKTKAIVSKAEEILSQKVSDFKKKVPEISQHDLKLFEDIFEQMLTPGQLMSIVIIEHVEDADRRAEIEALLEAFNGQFKEGMKIAKEAQKKTEQVETQQVFAHEFAVEENVEL